MHWNSSSSTLSLRSARIALALSALLLSSLETVLALPVPDSIIDREGARVIWDFESSSDGWGSPNMITGLLANKGCLRGTANGGDPYVSGPLLMETAFKDAAGVAVRIHMSATGPLDLYWENENGTFAETRRVAQTVPGQQWATVRFDLSAHPEWAGKTIRRLRLDPGEAGTSFAIDYIAAVPHVQQPDVTWLAQANNFDSTLDGWTAPSHVSSFWWEEGKLKGKTAGNDPWIVGPAISIADQTGVMAQFKASSNCTVSLYWTSTEGGFSEVRTKSVSYTNTGGWQLLKFDLRNHPEWAGKTITGLRLDPGNASRSNFEFDSILVSGSEGFDDVDGDLLDGVSELAFGTDSSQRSQIKGSFTHERWNNTNFYSTSALVAAPKFYSKPDIIRYDHPKATSPFYKVNYFSTRARGWITAPATGIYRFWISGVNGVQLLLSEDGSKYSKRKIAELNPEIGTAHGIPGSSANLWDNYDSQMSEEVHLTAGQAYHLEAIQTTAHVGDSHVSIAWAKPGQARTPLELAHIESYAPTADDIDDDYLPDAWEAQYGLNPQDNGYTVIGLDGERGDFDHDGLTNREEYLAGTHPANPDTDGDGVSDFDELRTYGTSPTEAGPPQEEHVASIPLNSFTAATANWTLNENGLVPDTFRGSIAWSFEVPTAGQWIIQSETYLLGKILGSEFMDIRVAVDGQSLGIQTLAFGANRDALLRIITPHLAAGTHTLELYIDNLFARRTLQIRSLDLFRPNGPDLDQDGIVDWVAAWLGQRDAVDAHADTSKTSPFFFEGKSIVAAAVQINNQPARPGADASHWFYNLPLDESANTSYQVAFPGGTTHTGEVFWSATNVLTGGSTTIRAGDSLKLGAWTTEGTGQATINISAIGTNGTLLGAVSSSTDAARGTKSLRIDGAGNNAIKVTDTALLDQTSKLTLSLWAKPDTASLDATPRALLSKRVGANNQTAYSLFRSQTGTLTVDLDDGISQARSYDTGYVVTDAWQFIAVVFDGDLQATERVKVYVDGNLVATPSHPGQTIRNLASDLFIGTMNTGYTYNGTPVSFGGLIDDVRIDRQALGFDQLEAIRTTGDTNASSPMLSACYDFEDAVSLGKDSSVTPTSFTVTGTAATAHRFLRKRDYTVTAVHSSGTTKTLTVRARHAVMPQNVTTLQNTMRYLDFSDQTVDPNLVFVPGDGLRLGARETLSGGKFRFALYPQAGGPLGVTARLAAGGPIVDIARIHSITFSDVLQNGVSPSFLSNDFPGYYLVYSTIVVPNLPPGGTIKVSIFRSGVSFLDGSTIKVFTAADLNQGILNLEFLYDATLTGGFCHYIDIFDANGTLIGRR